MKKLIYGLALLFLSSSSLSQGSIKGKITDSTGNQVLTLATVTVFKAADTTLVTYRLSNPEGEFRVPNLPLDIPLRVLISFSGYRVHRQEFILTADAPELNAGTIKLESDTKDLDEVLVIAERPPVSVRRDTIEFNASAFSTLPTALVEDLLKKLPGVQVDADGNITVGGRKVNRILVDGKEFFGNDPKMATRNLPANAIEKVQVSEDKDDAELNPDKPKQDIGQVINLKLKKGVKKGWFGKAYAGAGTDDLYEAGAIVNLFKDTMQVSLLGFTNNLNRAGFGFNDIRSLGGFDRSGTNSVWINSNGGINVNGINFGGMGEGINRSTGAGFNMNHVLKNGLTLNSQYFYGNSRNDIEELSNRQEFLGDTTLTTRTNRNEVLESFSHRFGLGLKGRIDSLSRFEFRPGLTITEQESGKVTDVLNSNNFKGGLSASNNQQRMDAKDVSYNHSLIFFKNFRKKNRTLSVNHYLNYSNVNNDQYNDVLNTWLETGSTTLLEQLRDRENGHFNTALNLTYNEPLSKQFSLRLGNGFTYFNNTDDLATFTKNASGKYEVPNPALTNSVGRRSLRNNVSAGLNWKYRQLSITATANWLRLDIRNEFKTSGNKVWQHYNYVLPGMQLNWKELNLGYSVNVAPPNITDIQPVPDNSNPLFIFYGNPDLEPAVTHNINLGYFKSIVPKSLFINAYLYTSIQTHAITRERTVDAQGVQRSGPVNVEGNQNLYTHLFINKQFKLNKKFQFTIGGGYNIDFNKNYVIANDRRGFARAVNFRPQLNASINWKDLIEWNISHNHGFGRTRYDNDVFKAVDINTHRTQTELVVRWPKNLVWETSLSYNYNSNVAPGLQKTVALLNGGVTFLFLKEQKGQLKLSAFDLLDENTNLWRFTNDNSIIDRQLNQLKKYYLLTFTYNIRSFKSGKVGGRERFFMF
ncbi:MAG TPA: TonB-dependent receptor [Chitinophagaceae bacterium]